MESAGIAHRTTPPPSGRRPSARWRPRGERPDAGARTGARRARPVLGRRARDYIALTKPRIISLLLWTTVMTMIVAKPSGPGALDRALDLPRRLPVRRRRRRDQPLHRPQDRRPHVADLRRGRSSQGRIEPLHGLIFGIVLGCSPSCNSRSRSTCSPAVLAMAGCSATSSSTPLAQAHHAQQHCDRRRRGRVPAAGRLGRRHRRADAAGALPVRDHLLWTPPHFWALALIREKDYARAGVPMLPVVRPAAPRPSAADPVYAILMLALTIMPTPLQMFGIPTC